MMQLGGTFDDLKVGTMVQVTLATGEGPMGAQASSVEIIGAQRRRLLAGARQRRIRARTQEAWPRLDQPGYSLLTVQQFLNLWVAHLDDGNRSEVYRAMFHLLLTTCFAGILCYGSQPDVEYVSAERCLEQGAILSGLARANLNYDRVEQASRIVCSGTDGTKATIFIGRTDAQAQQFPDDAMTLPTIN